MPVNDGESSDSSNDDDIVFDGDDSNGRSDGGDKDDIAFVEHRSFWQRLVHWRSFSPMPVLITWR